MGSLFVFLECSRENCKFKHGEHSTILSVLVTSKAAEINKQFTTLGENLAWTETPYLEGLIGAVSLSHAEYSYRVMDWISALPLQLHWLVESPPTLVCAERKRVAVWIVNAATEDLDSFTAKLRFNFPLEVYACSQTGKLDRE